MYVKHRYKISNGYLALSCMEGREVEDIGLCTEWDFRAIFDCCRFKKKETPEVRGGEDRLQHCNRCGPRRKSKCQDFTYNVCTSIIQSAACHLHISPEPPAALNMKYAKQGILSQVGLAAVVTADSFFSYFIPAQFSIVNCQFLLAISINPGLLTTTTT